MQRFFVKLVAMAAASLEYGAHKMYAHGLLTNYVQDPSVTLEGYNPGNHSMSNLQDGFYESIWWGAQHFGNYVRINLSTTCQIGTIYIGYDGRGVRKIDPNRYNYVVECNSMYPATYDYSICQANDQVNFQHWLGNLIIGNDPDISSGSNTQCRTGVLLDGVFTCSGYAQYIFIQKSDAGGHY